MQAVFEALRKKTIEKEQKLVRRVKILKRSCKQFSSEPRDKLEKIDCEETYI